MVNCEVNSTTNLVSNDSVAVVVGIDYSNLLLPANYMSSLYTIFQPFLVSRSPVLCRSRWSPLYYKYKNSGYVYKLINSITSLVLTSYPYKERVWWHKPKFLSLLKCWRLATVGVSRGGHSGMSHT